MRPPAGRRRLGRQVGRAVEAVGEQRDEGDRGQREGRGRAALAQARLGHARPRRRPRRARLARSSRRAASVRADSASAGRDQAAVQVALDLGELILVERRLGGGAGRIGGRTAARRDIGQSRAEHGRGGHARQNEPDRRHRTFEAVPVRLTRDRGRLIPSDCKTALVGTEWPSAGS